MEPIMQPNTRTGNIWFDERGQIIATLSNISGSSEPFYTLKLRTYNADGTLADLLIGTGSTAREAYQRANHAARHDKYKIEDLHRQANAATREMHQRGAVNDLVMETLMQSAESLTADNRRLQAELATLRAIPAPDTQTITALEGQVIDRIVKGLND